MSTVATTAPGVERWLEPALQRLPALAIHDAHTHLGRDCDGTVCEPAELAGALAALGADASVFPLHVADGDYRADNDAVLAAARASSGSLTPFCRLNPHTGPVDEGERAIAAGARGIKLHPRAEAFTLAHPAIDGIFALAHEHRLPVLIHAGRGIEPLGADALRLAARYPGATLILAHAAITDLAWMPTALDEHPNVLFDTAWWNPVDLLALFALVPPGRIVFGSDVPFGDPSLNALITLRCALEAGLTPEQVASVMGEQMHRVLAGEALVDAGPAPGQERLGRHLLLDRVLTYLAAAWGAALSGGTPAEPLALARMALDADAGNVHRRVFEAAREAFDLQIPGLQGLGGVAIAACLVATPSVPIDE